jgi:hypothetical protein
LIAKYNNSTATAQQQQWQQQYQQRKGNNVKYTLILSLRFEKKNTV